jgi:hypothetical protein
VLAVAVPHADTETRAGVGDALAVTLADPLPLKAALTLALPVAVRAGLALGTSPDPLGDDELLADAPSLAEPLGHAEAGAVATPLGESCGEGEADAVPDRSAEGLSLAVTVAVPARLSSREGEPLADAQPLGAALALVSLGDALPLRVNEPLCDNDGQAEGVGVAHDDGRCDVDAAPLADGKPEPERVTKDAEGALVSLA